MDFFDIIPFRVSSARLDMFVKVLLDYDYVFLFIGMVLGFQCWFFSSTGLLKV